PVGAIGVARRLIGKTREVKKEIGRAERDHALSRLVAGPLHVPLDRADTEAQALQEPCGERAVDRAIDQCPRQVAERLQALDYYVRGVASLDLPIDRRKFEPRPRFDDLKDLFRRGAFHPDLRSLSATHCEIGCHEYGKV